MITVTVGMAVSYHDSGTEFHKSIIYIVDAITKDKPGLFYLRNRDFSRIGSLLDIKALPYPFVLQLQDDMVVVAKSITAFVGEGDGSGQYGFYMSEWDYSVKPIKLLQEMVTAKFLLIQGGKSYQIIPVPQIKRFFLHPQWLTPPTTDQ